MIFDGAVVGGLHTWLCGVCGWMEAVLVWLASWLPRQLAFCYRPGIRFHLPASLFLSCGGGSGGGNAHESVMR
ncbi:hypothetical protein F5144DRAFT_564860 [Chaetomium tenue]|uniref:Uncharacterized protein n=1 Tax=Chaetomium tenue TaxID=1854479 RepID=A0ACB7PPS7_9PEZI|nr:hypothetical protein F5144DRAFT_564860 [Chaetomium globosum]